MTEEGSIYLSVKCRECKKKTLDGSMWSSHYSERGIMVDRDVGMLSALTMTATRRPLTIGIELSYEDTTYGQSEMWYSYRCDDPPCLITILRTQAHHTTWKEQKES